MTTPELAQLELLSQVDELVSRLTHWAEPQSAWEPMSRCRALVRRLLTRVETLRIRLEAPLVVATFGGTGTGKSSLVNAIVGRECTATGRQRPTTTRPILLAHPQTELDPLGLPLDDFEITRVDTPIMRDIVIIDCPDPDTSESETRGSNLQRLHQLLPHCDVLIYTSTQQKYRSARVGDELGQAATGCRLLFVQTHAELDEDIRDDWRNQLGDHYEVPDVFFVDSLRALEEQQAGQRPSGDFGRLQDLLTTELAASQRVQIRRANLIDLLHAALARCRQLLDENRPGVEQLETVLEEQRQKLTGTMAGQLRDELLISRNLWERRLLTSVTDIWGFSPFSSILRFYNGLGSLLASFTLFRARSSAQMALIGALQGARWLTGRREEQESDSRLEKLTSFGLDDAQLRESQIVIAGYVNDARLDPALADEASLNGLRQEAARVEDQFLGDARRCIDGIIDKLAIRNSGIFTRLWYELLFIAYAGFVLFRIGKNFFYDTFLKQLLEEVPVVAVKALTFDFYVSAGVFFVLWSGLLVMLFTRRLRRGLRQKIDEMAQELAENRISQGLFPQLERTCRELERNGRRLESIAEATAELRRELAASGPLGAQRTPVVDSVVVGAVKD